MTNTESETVWYAAYGSNLLRERFLCYLRGGTPEGCTVRAPGCTDPSDPTGDRALRIPHELYFARDRSGWGEGGVAFLRSERDDARGTLGRAYLVTRQQFVEVTAQENRCEGAAVESVLTDGLVTGDYTDFQGGWYGRVLCLGENEGSLILTFTGREDLSGSRVGPSAAYVSTILRGLSETFPDRPLSVLADYLAARTRGAWTASELSDFCRTSR